MNNSISELWRPEIQLLLLCSSTELDQDTRSKIIEIAHKDINWVYLTHLAEYHNIMQLFYLNINEICSHLVPKQVLSYMEEKFQESVKKNLVLTGELLKAFKLLKDNDINSIPFKGPSVAIFAYQNLALRLFANLDIYIKKEDIALARKILADHGYKINTKFTDLKSKSFTHYNTNYTFSNEETGAVIKTYWKFPSYPFSVSEEFDVLIDLTNLPEIEINSFKLPSLLPEDQLLILAMQNAGMYWNNISRLCDVSELVKHQNINWELLLEKANKLNLERILLINLSLAHELLNLNLPESILRKIIADDKIDNIKKSIKKEFLFYYQYISHPLYQEVLLNLKIRESSIYGIKDLFNIIFDFNNDDVMKSLFLRPLHNIAHPFKIVRSQGLFKPKLFINYVPSPPEVVDNMLKLANVTEKDLVYDLGCGDGRVVITAAKKYGARAVGVDIDPKRINESQKNAEKEGVEKLTKFIEKDVLKVDLSEASVITLWLSPLHMEKLRPKLEKELSANTRIVSRNFEIEGMLPVKTEFLKSFDSISGLYLWQIRS